MAHLDHKERAVGPHHEWDVSKSPFNPPGIIILGLKAPKKEPVQPRVDNLKIRDLLVVYTIVGFGKSLSLPPRSPQKSAAQTVHLKRPGQPLLNTIPDLHTHTRKESTSACSRVCVQPGKAKNSRRAPVPYDADALPGE